VRNQVFSQQGDADFGANSASKIFDTPPATVIFCLPTSPGVEIMLPSRLELSVATDNSFADVMERLQAGDQAAATELFERFCHRLIGLARLRLDARLRTKLDPEDVLQSVFRTFFRRKADGQFDLRGWDDVWSLLTVLTVRKCARWREHFQTAGRDVRMEVPVTAGGVAHRVPAGWVARDPSPEEAFALAELVELLLRRLDAQDREIATLYLQGYLPHEISTTIGRPVRSVHRVLQRAKEHLQQLAASDDGPP
jgi:RNA polymerase sigma-70 factor (ECF subfamily)